MKFHKKKKNMPYKGSRSERYVLQIERTDPSEFKELAEYVEKSSTVSRADALAVLDMLGYWAQIQLAKGSSVKLEGLCTLTPTVHCKSAAMAEELTVDNITRIGVRCTLSSELKQRLKNCTKSIVGTTDSSSAENSSTDSNSTDSGSSSSGGDMDD